MSTPRFVTPMFLVLVLSFVGPRAGAQKSASVRDQVRHRTVGDTAMQDSNWVELMKSMQTMDAAMGATKPSGNDDVDFVNLMLPHHQAAVDMAKAELLHGSDPQMHRLAQEIIADQESEIQLMQLWRDRQPTQSEERQTPGPQKEP